MSDRSADVGRRTLDVGRISTRLTAFAAAALLFAAQPLTGKWLLPDFGGAPGVWIVCLLVFQVAVILGCALAARVIAGRSSGRVVIGTLIAIATLALVLPGRPLVLPGLPGEVAALVAVLAWAGPAAVLCSATGPLLQNARSRSGNGDPYRLSAWANAGSLCGLLVYPLIEAVLGRSVQTIVLAAGLVVVGATLWFHLLRRPEAVATASTRTAPIRHRWWILPGLATVLLAGHTNVLCQELAPVPLLWVVPLALYLLTWILPFAHPRGYHRATALIGVLVANGLTVALHAGGAGVDALPRLVAELACLGFGCWACHGEVAALRPPAQDLGRFWTVAALGGAGGTLAVLVLAPLVLVDFSEQRLAVLPILGLIVLGQGSFTPSRTRFLASGLLVLILLGVVFSRIAGTAVHAERSWLGILAVRDHEVDGQVRRELRHGATVHGVQVGVAAPSAYYGASSGLGLVLAERLQGPPQRIAAVGLGIGTLAVWLRDQDRLTVAELDPAVTRLARTYFTCLEGRDDQVAIRHGDGRLVFAADPESYDLIVLDAFSGGAIPVHLLTAEAFAVWRARLTDAGICCIHLSNRHLDLAPVIRAGAESVGWSTLIVLDEDPMDALRCEPSRWAICTADPSRLAHLAGRAEGDGGTRLLWTDDRTPIIPLLRVDEEVKP